METTIRINTDQLTPDILEGIKKMFPHKTVDIIIQSADTTEYILDNPKYADELNERIESYQSNSKAFNEYQNWIQTDRKIALRIGDLIRDILRDPFNGIGKPEALKHQFKAFWSRRIDQEHRLIYCVTESSVVILSCYSHYN